jgi:NTE family protein
VLSGGGSLGAVQVGMLKALTENGCQPGLLIGASVGAINAAWMAGRPSHDGAMELEEIWLGLRRQDVFPFSPWSGARGLIGRSNHVISSANLRTLLEKHIPYLRLEEAAMPVHVITTELKTGRAFDISSGPAVPALLASTAIPGVFPPVTIGQRTLVDGGIASHTPIAAAIELGARQIYVLPVSYTWLNHEPTNALGMALHALARFVEQKVEFEVAAHKEVAEIHVLGAPDLPAVSPADFSRTTELIERGYKSTLRYLDAAPAPVQAAAPETSRKPLSLRRSPARAA